MTVDFEDRVGADDDVGLVYQSQANIKAKLKFGIGSGKDFRSSNMDLLPSVLGGAAFKDIGAMSKAVLLEQWTLNIINSSTFDVPTLANTDKQALLVKVSGSLDATGDRIQKSIVIPYYDITRDAQADADTLKSYVRLYGANNGGVSDIRVDSFSLIRQQ